MSYYLSAAEVSMRLHDYQRQTALAEAGQLPAPRDVLSKDNTHQSPDYNAGDPIYGGPIRRTGSAAMQFADIPRPDLGDLIV